MPLSITNLLHEATPLPGVTDTTFAVTTAVRPAATLTLDPSCQLVLLSAVGDLWYTTDATDPVSGTAHPLYDGSQMWINPSTFATLRVLAHTGTVSLRASQYQYYANSFRRASGLDGLLSTFTFNEVYSRVLQELRHDPATFDADSTISSTGTRAALASFIERRVRDIWTLDRWPDLEQSILAEVETDGTRSFVTLIDGDIASPGEILDLFPTDPFATSPNDAPTRLSYSLAPGYIYLHNANLPASVYVAVRPCPPRFTRTAWSGATAYTPGSVVYYATTGHCYLALQASTNIAPTSAAYWERQLIPAWMIDAILYGVLADWARHDGQRVETYSMYTADYRAALLRLRQQRGAQQRHYQFAGM